MAHWCRRSAPGFALLALSLCGGAAGAIAPGDQLPRFSDGSQSVEVLVVPGVVKRNRLETAFLCTSFDQAPVHIGVQIFNGSGVVQNDVAAGGGAVLNVGFGETVTFGTSGSAALLESVTIPLTGFQGAGRVVATSDRVLCNVLMLDDAVSPPVTLATLGAGIRPTAGAKPGGLAMPTFSNGVRATHSEIVTGVIKRGRMETAVFCTSLSNNNINLGIEILAADGSVQNDVGAGNGAVLNFAPGHTVTFGTTGTAAFLENQVISTGGVAQGAARIVSDSPDVACNVFVLDAAVSPPTSMSSLTD